MNRETTLTLHLLRAISALGRITDAAGEYSADFKTARDNLNAMRDILRASAPEMWQVEADLTEILAGRAGCCPLPREFSVIEELAPYVGLPLISEPGIPVAVLTLADEPFDEQTLREAMIKIGRGKMPPVLYHGPYKSAGHHLHGPGGRSMRLEDVRRLGFPVSANNLYNYVDLKHCLDGEYCPGKVPGDYRRTRPEVEGEAKLTHENGMTILGIWDHSVDKRGACNSAYVALGVYDFAMMCKLCEAVYPERWRTLTAYAQIKLVEKNTIDMQKEQK